MRIAIFGSTGGTGRALVMQAMADGHEVTAFVRQQSTLLPAEKHNLRIVVGDIADQETVDRAVRDQDVVISALGSQKRGVVTTCSDGIRAILVGMQRAGVRRLLAVSAYGTAETHDWSLYALAVWTKIAAKMRDMEAMEEMIRASDVDWTIVRPPRLTDGPRTGTRRAGQTVKIGLTSKISRADLAAFLLEAAANRTFIHVAPTVAEPIAI